MESGFCFYKSSVEEQMEMMLMQIDKLPDFSGAANEFPFSEFGDNNHHITYDLDSLPPAFMMNMQTDGFSGGVDRKASSGFPFSDGRWEGEESRKRGSVAAMREMIFRIAAMQPIHIDPESVKPPKRKNVKISTDPQSVAARHRREKISERIRILQRLVPGGTKMDTASMLDEAIHYVKFLKNQVQSLERVASNRTAAGSSSPIPMYSGNHFPGAPRS